MTKKLFGRDTGMRTTFLKYDPCVTGPKCSVECENCMVSLISDRFLGEKFEKEVLSKKYKKTKNLFTYVLIADTIGCNLNCWFCYAWKYLKMEDAKKCMPHFLSAKELAKQFDCKIRKTADLDYMGNQIGKKTAFDPDQQKKILEHIGLELPFSRIRISGGEPVFSNNDVFQTDDKSEDIITQTIKYWIEFFEELDRLIGHIKKEKLINIAESGSDWQTLKHPVWLTEAKNRIMIRFDTNGIIFGKEKFVKLFYSKLFQLFKENKLNNLNIQIDYSFKGATPKEYMWSQSAELPPTQENNDKEFNPENHPQIGGYLNIISCISEFVKQDRNFKECVSITVEKGIDHDPKNKLRLYYNGSMDWEKLAAKLGTEFSDVINIFDLNFGWRVDAKIQRYANRGAVISITDGSEIINTVTSEIQEIKNFRKQHFKDRNFMINVYPVGHKVELLKRSGFKPVKETEDVSSGQNFWIITGSEENLKIGLKHGIWGVGKSLKGLWEKLREGDMLLFYCTKPVSGIIGYGKVTDKKIDNKPFWPNEPSEEESKYPFRIIFSKKEVFNDWQKERKILEKDIEYYHGLNYVEQYKQQYLIKKLNLRL